MSDDRTRHPRRDEGGDLPPDEGTRSDHAGTGTGDTVSPAPPAGETGRPMDADTQPGAADKAAAPVSEDPGRSGPLSGSGTGASGGYGSGSGYGSSGGSPDGEESAGTPGPQTDWLREAPGAGDEGGPEGRDDAGR